MTIFCTNCGSQNHLAKDCTKPKRAEPLPMPAPAQSPQRKDPGPERPAKADTKGPVRLDPPRWPGGPQICPAANLPAFATEREMNGYFDTNAPSLPEVRRWQCDRCGMWHRQTGHGAAPRRKYFMRDSTIKQIDAEKRMHAQRQPEQGQQEFATTRPAPHATAPAAPAKPIELPMAPAVAAKPKAAKKRPPATATGPGLF